MIKRWMSTTASVLALTGLALAAGTTAAAEPITVPQLQRLLQAAAKPAVAFEELRESPWLSSPVATRGVMRSTPQALEKEVLFPRRETWRLLGDRMEWSGGGGDPSKQILFKQAPALAPLSQVMRHVVAGELVALQTDFNIQLTGDAQAWSASLTPRSADVSRYLEQVELQGTAGQLQVIIVSERKGERTTTRLRP